MSNLIFAAWRRHEDALEPAFLGAVLKRITLAELPGRPGQVREGAQEITGLTGPTGAARMEGNSAMLGAFAGPSREWHMPGAEVPDGTFALLRTGEGQVELCTDYAGSRSLWYVLEGGRFFASTSQRALAALLGSFELNRASVGWFLSSGIADPKGAWDARVRRLPPNARLTLDRVSWKLSLSAPPVELSPEPMDRRGCEREFAQILRETIQSYDFGSGNWVLPLSGGVDSRCILAALCAGGAKPRTITWGKAESLTQPGNDAFVARQLATRLGLVHDYLLTEGGGATPELVVDRFLTACGGSTEQLMAYLDGLLLWNRLASQGVDGIIRGDEGFPFRPVRTLQQARTASALVLLTDFMDEGRAEELSGGGQPLPEDYRPRPGESAVLYRNRVYHAYRIPVGLAALSDVKTPFVEIANPLLSRRILEFVRRMPEALTRDRGVYVRAVQAMAPSVPFASMAADDDKFDFLWSAPYVSLLREELAGEKARSLFPEWFLRDLGADLDRGAPPRAASRSFRAAVKRVIPPVWIRKAKTWLGRPDEVPVPRVLVMRAALASRTVRMMEADAAFAREVAQGVHV